MPATRVCLLCRHCVRVACCYCVVVLLGVATLCDGCLPLMTVCCRVMDAYRRTPDDLYLLEVGLGGVMGSLTNINDTDGLVRNPTPNPELNLNPTSTSNHEPKVNGTVCLTCSHF